MNTRNVFCHSGDLGDIIAALPSMRALGGGDIVIGPLLDGQFKGRESMKGARFDAIKPLLEEQPYIVSVTWEDSPKAFTHDFRDFRQQEQYGESLVDWQARYLGVTVSTDPWLTCRRSEKSIGRAVIARSMRYRNPGFPWSAVLHKYKERIFVGLKEEYDDFKRNNRGVEFVPTSNLLELAEVINGADIFIGNQSCPFWIAAGLGQRLIQEGWPQQPNSQIKRANTQYLIRGPFSL